MSELTGNIIIQTGPDPRDWPEFAAIREEINKINHPARPEVSWSLIESLSLSLFRSNGVDLQTAAYYTLARTHKQGLAGFTEGCELLAAMVVNQWDQLWPQQGQARTEILEWFNARVGSQLRQHSFESRDLPMIFRAERALQLLCDKLQQVELSRVPRIENLLYLMQNTAKRLEAPTIKPPAPAAQPKQTLVYLSVPQYEPEPPVVPVHQPETPARQGVEVRFSTPAAKRSPVILGFAAGVFFSAMAAVVVYMTQVRPLQQQLNALAKMPDTAVVLWLSKPTLPAYPEQISVLEDLSPLAALQTADRVVAKASSLWPKDPLQIAQTQRWQQLQKARADNAEEDSYFQLRLQLKALSDKLVEQEKAHGSLTISYLKTAVYQMQNELNRATPLEELLRQMAVAVEMHQPPSPLLINQTDERWNALLSRYHQLLVQGQSAR
ncbi:VasL domain-containing protein [Scandinavium manionii]|uniref:VasL domain-containing protein n=1 Tax=Scandinavium manionii TaxID=2926520 RepID=UPI002165E308|nr:VasL domain-containing protein [Scandinavium manionii]MCS2167887.1 type VI secretion system ImpA family N-terminal domain-containing protein [Scandinavium manionii]